MKPGDAARRVGMVESDFRSINSIPPNMLIKAGSSLLVTRSTLLDADVAPSVADHGQMSLAPDVVLKRSVVQAHKGDTSASLSLAFSGTPRAGPRCGTGCWGAHAGAHQYDQRRAAHQQPVHQSGCQTRREGEALTALGTGASA